MTKHGTILTTASLAVLLPLFAPAPVARADIFQWEYINPADPSLGKQQSTTLVLDGAGVNAQPGAELSNRYLAMAYLIGMDLTGATAFGYADLTNADLSQANLTNVDFSGDFDDLGSGVYPIYLNGANLAGANLTTANFYIVELAGASLVGADARGARFIYATLTGANLRHANLTNAVLGNAFLNNADLSHANLANAWFPDTWLDDANLTGVDARGALALNLPQTAITTNLIRPNGHIAGLDLTTGASLIIRDYDGNPVSSPPTDPLPIVVESQMAMDATGTLLLVFDADPWDSTISFAPGIPVTLGGTLELTFAPDVDVTTQSGRTIDLFDWTGVTPSGALTVSSPHAWDLSKLYTTGEVTLAAAPNLNGDFNFDGTVDAADYIVWRKNGGMQDGYNTWRTNFGATAGGTAAAASSETNAAVPEPTSLAIVATCALFLCWRKFRPPTRSVYVALALFATATIAHADIFQWEYVNPADPSQGRQQSTTLAPDGAGVNAEPAANLSNRNLTMAYMIGADLAGYFVYDPQGYHIGSVGAANLTGVNLSQADLSNANLGGRFDITWYGDWIFLDGSDLTDANLTQANLSNANFYSTTLTGANLTGAEVRGANFDSSGITAAQLYSTDSYQAHDLAGIKLGGNLVGLNLASQNLTGARFLIANLTNANFSQANLAGADLSQATLTGADFSQANATNASFSGATLTNANLGQANLTGATFFGATLTNANLSGALLTGAQVAYANFNGAGLTPAQIYSTASYQNGDLSAIGLANTDLTGVNFSGVNLSGEYLSADLSNAILSQANLTNAKFGYAILTGANLTGAEVRGAYFNRDDEYSPGSGLTLAQLYSTASYLAHDLSGIGLTGHDLTGANLAGRNLTNADFFLATLIDANLSGADLTNAALQAATLTNANLAGANLTNANVASATLTGANLTGAEVRGASFDNTGITPAQLYSTASYLAHDLTGIGLGNSNLAGANLAGQNLTNANFNHHADLTGANLSQANLTNANVEHATLTNANLTQANLTNANFTLSTLTGANLTGAEVRGANFYGLPGYGSGLTVTQLSSTASYQARDLAGIKLLYNNLPGINLANQNLANADLTGATLTGASFNQANLTGANFESTMLTNANFNQANLTNAEFGGATLTGANLTGADVRGANLWYSGLTKAQLYSTASYQSHDLTGTGLGGNNLSGANLAGQNLTSADFYYATLTNANFNQANLTNAFLGYATLTGANLTGAEVRGASFMRDVYQGVGGITAAQLYSTTSYLAGDLTGIKFGSNNLSGVNLASQNLTDADFTYATLTNADFRQANLMNADFSTGYEYFYGVNIGANLTGANLSQANLTNANFSGFEHCHEYGFCDIVPGANLTNVNLSGADARGANFQYANLMGANTSNLIQSDGRIAGLNLTTGASLVVRDYDGNLTATPPTGPLPIIVEQQLGMDATGTLRLVFDADPWDSTISFAPGIPVALGGTLELAFAPDVDVATQSGRTIDLFDWTGVTPTGAFTVSSPHTWDLSKLYTTGEVTLAAAPNLNGDFNFDGTVDAADYIVWRKSSGTTYKQEHFNVWRANFGATLGSGSGASAQATSALVPEPTTLFMFLVGMIAMVACRRAVGGYMIGGRAVHGWTADGSASWMLRLPALFFAFVIVLGVAGASFGQTLWTNGTGNSNWFTPGNWSLGVPNNPGDAIIGNGGTAQLQAPGGSVRRLRVGVAGGSGHLLVDGGALVVTDDLHLNEGSAGPASMIVQGGSTVTAPDTVVGFNSAADTSFLISGPGTVYNATNDFTVGRLGAGVASLTLEDGAVLSSNTSTIGAFAGSTGVYTLSGGSLINNVHEYIGLSGTGTFNQSGGSNEVKSSTSGFFSVGHNATATGTYNLNGTGALSVATHEYIGYFGSGNVVQTSGSNTITGSKSLYLGYEPNAIGNYTLSGTGTLSVSGYQIIGYTGTGNFTQLGGSNSSAGLSVGSSGGGIGTYTHSGGTNSVAGGTVVIGDVPLATGTYFLSGTGSLNASSEFVGGLGAGAFNQSGGTNNVGSDLIIGYSNVPGAMGAYTLSAGLLSVGGSEAVGGGGPAVFNQTGGVHTVVGSLELGSLSGATGSYSISGGSVSAFALSVGGSLGGSGGTGVLTVSGPAVVNVGVGRLTVFDTPGSALNLSGGTINAAALNFSGTLSRLNWTGGTLNLTTNVTWDSAATSTSTSAAFGAALAIGNNRTLMVMGNETLGGAGAFALTLDSGSTHHVTGALTIAANGALTQNPGSTLTAPTITQAGGAVNGTLENQANFVYQTGSFNGRMINNGAVSFGSSFTVANGIENRAPLTVLAGQTLTTNGAGLDNRSLLTVAADGSLVATSAVNQSELVVNGTASAVTFTNAAILHGVGQVTAAVTNAASGDVRVVAGERLRFAGASFANQGLVEAIGNPTSPAEIEFNSPVTNAASTGLIAGRNNVLRFNGGLTNQGSLAMSIGTSDVFGDISNAAMGKIIVSGGSGATFYDDIIQNGTFRVSKVGSTTSVAVVFGAFSGSGGSTGGGDIFFEGDLRPGNSPASVTFDNNVSFGSGTTTNIELGGIIAGTEYDQIHVTGSLALHGVLDVSLIDFSPSAGQSFDILDWDSLSGAFSSINLPTLAGLVWDTSQLYTTGVLSVAAPGLPGDYNQNGTVDAADYVVWRKTGINGPTGYDTWRTHFGEPGGSAAVASANATVPEPAMLVMIIVAAVGESTQRRWRKFRMLKP